MGCGDDRKTFCDCLTNKDNYGQEPWSSGYGRRLMSWRLWVWIQAAYTGWNLSHLFSCKIHNGFFRKTKNKQKRGWDGPLKTKINYYSGFDPFSFHRNLTLGLSLCTFRCWARPSWCWSFWPSRTRRTWRFPDILLRSSSGSGFVQSTSASAWTPDVP